MISGIFEQGDVEIIDVSITLNNGTRVGIESAFREIKLYEDLFANTIHGTISMFDGFDLLNTGPLYGEEFISIALRTPGIPSKHEVRFIGQIVRISDRIQITDKLQTYDVHFVSPEVVINENKKISKHFRGEVSSLITQILTDAQFLGSSRPLVAQPTGTMLEVTTPFWSPFKIINWLTTRSVTPAGIPDYIFTETLTDGFQFKSISSLIQSPSIMTFWRAGADPSENSGQYTRIEELYMDDVSNYMQRVHAGTYASRLIAANATTKTLKVTNVTSSGYFPKTPHLNKYDVIGPTSYTATNAMMVNYLDLKYSFDNQLDQGFENWLLQRNHLLGRLQNIRRIDIKVGARFDIQIGQTCDIMIERSHTIGEGDNQTNTGEYLSGKYLITAICHTITPDKKHHMVLQCTTDSLAKELK